MEDLGPWLPLLIPVLLLQLLLWLIAFRDWFRRENAKGSRWIWLAVIFLGGILGPIAYLMFGREEWYGDE